MFNLFNKIVKYQNNIAQFKPYYKLNKKISNLFRNFFGNILSIIHNRDKDFLNKWKMHMFNVGAHLQRNNTSLTFYGKDR